MTTRHGRLAFTLAAILFAAAACSERGRDLGVGPDDGVPDEPGGPWSPTEPGGPWWDVDPVEVNVDPAWSPDGNRIAYMHAPQGPWDDVPPELNQLWLFSIEDGTNEYLGPGHSPTWAPTGDRLVFDIGSVLWILDLPSGEKSQLTDFAYAFQPRWSPDNQRILFMRWAPSQGLWTISPDGSDLRELGLPSFSADWSPTGNAIVFNSADGFELLTMNLSDGTPELLVSNTPARCTYPRWAPDDSWIAYYRSYEDERGLWVVRPDGQDAHCLIPDGKRASWSPDGKRLVYEHLDREANTYDLWIFSMETEASEPLFPEWP